MNIPERSALALFVVLLSACSSIPFLDNKIDYKSAGKLPPLEVPPDLTAPKGDDRFSVPDINPQGTATFSDYSKERATQPEAGSTDLLPVRDKVRIERAGTQRWIVVPGTPEALWPIVKDFWKELGFVVKTETPEAGIMETDWAENRANIPETGIRNWIGKVVDNLYSTSERDKFRTRMERGTEPGTTEIYISHRGMTEVYTTTVQESTAWQPRPADTELEAEMLRRLMVRFGVEDERAKTQVAAIQQEDRATLSRAQDGTSGLSVADDFDRAWRRVGLALDRVGFTVEDRDRSNGLYFVRYVDPQEDNRTAEPKGMLSKLLFWRGSGDKPNKNNAEQYRIKVVDTDTDSGSRVQVLAKDGSADRSKTANKILSLLYEQLK
ncbi:MAG: outer membrane protein assembly factor BamC [Burkholderiales bacterium]|nr:outer membrane protein assembly factor BamC [Burkholderiales bacterium]